MLGEKNPTKNFPFCFCLGQDQHLALKQCALYFLSVVTSNIPSKSKHLVTFKKKLVYSSGSVHVGGGGGGVVGGGGVLVVVCWWWCVGGGVLVVVCWWWCVGGGVLVVVVSGGGVVVVW